MKDILENRNPWDVIGAARAEFEEKIWHTKEGVLCPVCARSSRVVPKRICKVQAKSLIWLYQNTKPYEFIHFNGTAPRVLVKNAEVGKMKHWGLIEQMPNEEDPTKLKSGWVRITHAGRAFVEGAEIPKVLYIHLDKCLGEPEEKERATINDVLKEDFDIRKIMVEAI